MPGNNNGSRRSSLASGSYSTLPEGFTRVPRTADEFSTRGRLAVDVIEVVTPHITTAPLFHNARTAFRTNQMPPTVLTIERLAQAQDAGETVTPYGRTGTLAATGETLISLDPSTLARGTDVVIETAAHEAVHLVQRGSPDQLRITDATGIDELENQAYGSERELAGYYRGIAAHRANIADEYEIGGENINFDDPMVRYHLLVQANRRALQDRLSKRDQVLSDMDTDGAREALAALTQDVMTLEQTIETLEQSNPNREADEGTLV